MALEEVVKRQPHHSFIEIHDEDDGRVWALDESGHVFTYDHDNGLWDPLPLNRRERETLVPK